MHIDARRPRLPVATLGAALVAAVLLLGLTTTTAAGATTMTPRCNYVNLRTGPSTTYAKKTSINTGVLVTVVATVSGGSYGSYCPSWVTGASWYRISAVNGRSVSSLYGVSYVYGASQLFKAVATATPAPSPSKTPTPTLAPAATAPPPSPSPSAAPSSAPSPSPSVAPSPVPLPAGVTRLGPSVEFYGRGYGHGVGMSQYGAAGRASAGQSAATILAHYYAGTTLGAIANANIRVLVLASFSGTTTNPLRIYGLSGSWTVGGVTGTFPAGAQLKVTRDLSTTTGWRITVTSATGTLLLNAGAPSTAFSVHPAAIGTILQLYSKPTSYDQYRGDLRILANSNATLNVVNVLPIESYLRGVVPVEMSSTWPTQALWAQAVAARSYATYRLHPGTGTFDVYDDTRSQVYRGSLAEKTTTNGAVASTAGKVVMSSGKVANTLYHSADGGWTENNENVFVSSSGAIVSGAVGYLRGSSDRAPDGSSYDKTSPRATWHTNLYTLAQVQAIWAADSRTNVGTLIGLDLRNRGVSGRLISVTLYGANGTTKTVSGAVFISVFNVNTPATDPAIWDTLVALNPIP